MKKQFYFIFRLKLHDCMARNKSYLFLSIMFLSVQFTFAQVQVSGMVVDDNNIPMPGVSVVETGTQNGTSTDFDGDYQISVSSGNASLTFSYLGYVSQTVAVNSRGQINVTLIEDTEQLDEVVVIGYSTVKKSDLTGAVAQISAEELQEIPSSNITSMLSGRLAGVSIVNTNGTPGAAPSIQVRGVRSINAGNAPLIIVDGTIYSGDITEINPSDIESVNVLKDASSTAIYGFRGANGVVVITTKRGTSGKLKASFSSSYGTYWAMDNIDMQDDQQYLQYVRESFKNSGDWASEDDDEIALGEDQYANYLEGMNTDWHDIVIGSQRGIQQNNYFSLSGGNQNTKVRLGLGLYDEEFIYPGSEFLRYSVNAAFDHKSKNRKVEYGANVNFTYSDQKFSPNPYLFVFRQSPFLPAYELDGSVDLIPRGGDPFQISPLSNYEPGAVDESEWKSTTRLTGYLKYNFNDNLSLKVNANGTFVSSFRGRFRGIFSSYQWGVGTPNARTQTTFNHYYTLNSILNYNKSFGKHNINVMGVAEVFNRVNKNTVNEGEGGFESLLYYDLSTYVDNLIINSNYAQDQSLSFLGRAEYNYDNRYYFTASARYDGASRLAEGNKWALFPSASARWRISEENFFNNDGVVNNLNLRLSAGQSGNQAVDRYDTLGLLGSNDTAFGAGTGTTYVTTSPNTIDSPDLGWEITTSYNIGIELGMFNDRLNLEVDGWRTNTDDLILERDLPRTSGFAYVFENIGKTKATGIDVTLGATVVSTPKVSWDLQGVFSWYEDELVELYGGLDELVSENLFVGERFQGIQYGYKYAGIWQAEDMDPDTGFAPIENFNLVPGDVKLEDVNDDGRYDAEDFVILGTNVPRTRASLRSILRVGNFDLTTLFDSAWGVSDYDQVVGLHDEQTGRFGIPHFDYWTEDNTTARHPRPYNGGGSAMPNSNASTYVDMNWVKLRELTLGYSFGKKFLEAQNVFSNLRFTVSGQNFLLWSNYDWGLDPEKTGGISANATNNGPSTTMITFGVKADF